MRALVVASRFPWPSTTGDRLRASEWVAALGGTFDVTLVSPVGDASLVPAAIRHVGAPVSSLRAAGAAFRTLARGLPLHDALGGRVGWDSAFRSLRGERFDIVVCLLTRTLPWIDARALAPRLVVDAVDALSRSMDERARGARGPLRAFWAREARLTSVRETLAASDADAVVVVGEAEREPFGGRAIVIPVGVEIRPPGDSERDLDCAFWGRLGFFANRDAAELLLREIWPSIREALPAARLVIAGADAPASIRAANGRDGVEIESPMNDRVRLLRRARVAVMPVRFGTGQSVKLLEACEAGLAVAAFPAALRGVAFPDGAAEVRTTPDDLARAVIAMLRDRDATARMAHAGRDWVMREFDREKTRAMMRELAVRVVAG
ncbi:MAG: glycosyltransferase [Thermoanaerobaculia bacterium]|jgi:glycosyltransferase involved in cell wall biosynthesis